MKPTAKTIDSHLYSVNSGQYYFILEINGKKNYFTFKEMLELNHHVSKWIRSMAERCVDNVHSTKEKD